MQDNGIACKNRLLRNWFWNHHGTFVADSAPYWNK